MWGGGGAVGVVLHSGRSLIVSVTIQKVGYAKPPLPRDFQIGFSQKRHAYRAETNNLTSYCIFSLQFPLRHFIENSTPCNILNKLSTKNLSTAQSYNF